MTVEVLPPFAGGSGLVAPCGMTGFAGERRVRRRHARTPRPAGSAAMAWAVRGRGRRGRRRADRRQRRGSSRAGRRRRGRADRLSRRVARLLRGDVDAAGSPWWPSRCADVVLLRTAHRHRRLDRRGPRSERHRRPVPPGRAARSARSDGSGRDDAVGHRAGCGAGAAAAAARTPARPVGRFRRACRERRRPLAVRVPAGPDPVRRIAALVVGVGVALVCGLQRAASAPVMPWRWASAAPSRCCSPIGSRAHRR